MTIKLPQEVLLPRLNLEGLGVVALQEALDKLGVHQSQVRTELFRVLHRSTSAPQAPKGPLVPAQEQQSVFDAVLGALCSTTTLLPETAEAYVAAWAQQYRALSSQVQELSSELNRQKAAADIQAQIDEFRNHMQQGQFSTAAWCMVRLQRIVKDGAAAVDEGTLTAEGLQQMREDCAACQNRLLETFDACGAGVLQVERQQQQAVAQPSPALPDGQRCSLQEVLAAMEVVGVRAKYLQQLTDVVLTQLVVPLLQGPPCHVEVMPPAGQQQPAVLRWQPVSEGGRANKKDTAEQACRQVLKLLGQHLLGLETEAIKAFGDVFWRQLSDEYLRLAAEPTLAAQAEDVDACERVVEAAQDLEAYAEGLGFLEEPYLGPAVEAAARIALSSRQEAYLLEARRLLLLSDQKSRGWSPLQAGQSHSEAPVSVGQDVPVDADYMRRLHAGSLQAWEVEDPPCGCSTAGSPAALGRYKVERSFEALIDLVEKALSDACASGNRAVARALRAAVCSIALMARTLPATTGPPGWLAVPQLALLHHNGLWHLADALLLLAAGYSPLLEPLLGEPLVLLEEALLLRQSARQLLTEQISVQQHSLGEQLDGLGHLNRLGSTGSAQIGIAYRKAVRQANHSLSRLGAVLVEVLTPSNVVDAASAVLASACSCLVTIILDKRDIGIDDSKEIADILQPIADEGPRLLLAMPSGGTSSPAHVEPRLLSGIPFEQLHDAIVARCTPLRKLRTVLRILQAKMAQIVVQWQRGRLQADGLSCEEVRSLIRALFEESDKRQEALVAISDHE